MEYSCHECNSTDVYTKPVGKKYGIYCRKCNAFIRWTTYSNMLKINKNIKQTRVNDDVVLRHCYRKDGVTTIRCGECGCLLHNSNFPKIMGQFDLSGAKFCPSCGKELI